jgi:hypothetical protein
VNRELSHLTTGEVHIQFTIFKDGSVITKVLEGAKDSNLHLLLAISLDSITKSAPFTPFTDSMIAEVGNRYTDDFTFTLNPQSNN